MEGDVSDHSERIIHFFDTIKLNELISTSTQMLILDKGLKLRDVISLFVAHG
jgi:hypothetical protein